MKNATASLLFLRIALVIAASGAVCPSYADEGDLELEGDAEIEAPAAQPSPSGPLAPSAPARKGGSDAVIDFEADVIQGERRKPDILIQLGSQPNNMDGVFYGRKDFSDYHRVDYQWRPRYDEILPQRPAQRRQRPAPRQQPRGKK